MFLYVQFEHINTIKDSRDLVPSLGDGYTYLTMSNHIVHTGSFMKESYLQKFTNKLNNSEIEFTRPQIEIYNLVNMKYGYTWTIQNSLISILTGKSSFDTFFIHFYIGIIIVAFLIVALCIHLFDKLFAACSLIFLSFYYGSGPVHGFNWIVPSFYSVLFFLFIAYIFIQNDNKRLLLILATPAFILSWQLSLIAAGILTIFSLLLYVYRRSFIRYNLLNTSLFVLISILSFFAGKIIMPSKVGLDEVSLSTLIPAFIGAPLLSFNDYSLEVLNIVYITPLKESSLFLMLIASIILITFFSKKKEILFLFLSTILVSIISFKHYYGRRMMIYVLPLTYLISSYMLYYIIFNLSSMFRKYFKNKKRLKKKILKLFNVSVIIILFLIWFPNFTNYFIDYNENQEGIFAGDRNFDFKRECIEDLRNISNPRSLILYDDINAIFVFIGEGLLDRISLDLNYSKQININNKDIFIISQNCNNFGRKIMDCGYVDVCRPYLKK